MTDDQWITFKCLEVTQPIGTFYVGVVNSHDVLRVSYSDVRRIEGEQRGIETYLGIERPLNAKRVAEIKRYVKTVDAAFPSAVIVAVGSADARYDADAGLFSLRDDADVAKVLDGQHRIAGVEDYEDGAFELIVTVFVDMDIEDQALVFATINLEQKGVNKSLAYDLFDYAKSRSPQKTAHNIVRLLDSRADSPFFGKIKILGTAGDPGEVLSQASFVEELLRYITKDAMADRDILKRGGSLPMPQPDEQLELIFRAMFIASKDEDIALVVWNFFAAVQEKWGDYWREVRRGFVLNRTTGFKALMRFLRPAYLSITSPGGVPDQGQFSTILSRINLPGSEFTPDNFPPGVSGQTKLRNMLLSRAGLDES